MMAMASDTQASHPNQRQAERHDSPTKHAVLPPTRTGIRYLILLALHEGWLKSHGGTVQPNPIYHVVV